jgi:hypothetical protein
MWLPNSGSAMWPVWPSIARSNTAWEHAAEIRRIYGYRDFSDPRVSFPRVRWLSHVPG